MVEATRREGSRVAVLGGTGWLGRHVCATFAERGYGVVAAARNHAPHVAGYRFHKLDLVTAPTEEIVELLRSERVDVVVNATDSTNTTDGWVRTDAELAQVNVTGVEHVLDAAGALPWPVRFVHLGTIHEYGPVESGVAIDETRPPKPVNSYARSKLAGAEVVLNAARAKKVDGVVLRLVNLCGPHPSPASFPGKLVQMFQDAGDAGEVNVTVTDARRDYVDVRDAAEALAVAAEADVSGQVINIGGGTPVEIRELVRVFAEEAGLAARLSIHNGPVQSLGGEWIQADITRAKILLGWRPRIGLRRSLRDTWLAAAH